jgi:hypothetical protein
MRIGRARRAPNLALGYGGIIFDALNAVPLESQNARLCTAIRPANLLCCHGPIKT